MRVFLFNKDSIGGRRVVVAESLQAAVAKYYGPMITGVEDVGAVEVDNVVLSVPNAIRALRDALGRSNDDGRYQAEFGETSIRVKWKKNGAPRK
jgi:hypothetical protein